MGHFINVLDNDSDISIYKCGFDNLNWLYNSLKYHNFINIVHYEIQKYMST